MHGIEQATPMPAPAPAECSVPVPLIATDRKNGHWFVSENDWDTEINGEKPNGPALTCIISGMRHVGWWVRPKDNDFTSASVVNRTAPVTPMPAPARAKCGGVVPPVSRTALVTPMPINRNGLPGCFAANPLHAFGGRVARRVVTPEEARHDVYEMGWPGNGNRRGRSRSPHMPLVLLEARSQPAVVPMPEPTPEADGAPQRSCSYG